MGKWNWWFGFGECKCYEGWSGECCDEWAVSDWNAKVAAWSQGKSCKAMPNNACDKNSNLPAAQTFTRTWKHVPDSMLKSQSQCEANNCMWVECFEASGNSLPYSSNKPEEMCAHCGGPWKGKCEWKHYAPGFLAFAGPGEHCGFQYPQCPTSEAKHCFCGEAAQKVREAWCSNNAAMDFCPNAMTHGDGRTQECSWNGDHLTTKVGGA